jgi:hypothetical protein
MAEGTLGDLREGRLEGSGLGSARQKENAASNGKGAKSSRPAKSKDSKSMDKVEKGNNARKPRAQEQDDDDEDSDGGFFE